MTRAPHSLTQYRLFLKALCSMAMLLVMVTLVDLKWTIWSRPSSISMPSSKDNLQQHVQHNPPRPQAPLQPSKQQSFFPEGALDVSVEGDEEGMRNKCVAVRLKGHNSTLSLEEALPIILERQQQTSSALQVGLVFLDKPNGFLSSGKVVNRQAVFHLYHYLEFLLVGYQQLQEILTGMLPENTTRVYLSSPKSPVHVPWIYVPLMQAPMEVCGVAEGMNCAIAQLLLKVQQWYGMESNPQELRDFHPAYHGQHEKRQWNERRYPLNQARQYQEMQTADAVLLVSLRRRDRCNHVGRNQHGWNAYSAVFPMDAWHDSLVLSLKEIPLPKDLTAVATTTTPSSSSPSNEPFQAFLDAAPQQLMVCYVDRQATSRRMPDSEHEWLVNYLAHHSSIQFWHLHMQNYTGVQQLRVASECHVMIGVHGNGLSHILWMKPRRYVVELYWDTKTRQGGYQLLSETMHHKYLALRMGLLVLDATNPDPSKQVQEAEGKSPSENARTLIRQFLDRALFELGIPGAPPSMPTHDGKPVESPPMVQYTRPSMRPPRQAAGTKSTPSSKNAAGTTGSTALTTTTPPAVAMKANTHHHDEEEMMHVDDFGDTHPRHCHGSVKHIHLAVGRDPQRSMTVSFASKWSDGQQYYDSTSAPPPVIAGVRYGTRPDRLDLFVGEQELPLSYNTTYPEDSRRHSKLPPDALYFSPYQHHITLTNLEPGTTYYYLPVVGRRHLDKSTDEDLQRLTKKSWKDHPTQHFKNYIVNEFGKREFRVDKTSTHRRLAPKPYNGLEESCPESNRVRSFSTASSNEQLWQRQTATTTTTTTHGQPLVRFGIVGDLGQFTHSQETLDHMLHNQDTMDAVLLVGDIAYTNNDHRRWDTFFDFLDDYPIFHTIPLQIATGNHDVEKPEGRKEIFQSYETRFRMPRVHPAELGTYDNGDGLLDMNEPPYPLPYEWGNAYYSFSYGPAKHIVVSAYSSMEPNSTQYKWLVEELANVDREETPWLLLTMHVPIYNTFKSHHKDLQILAAQQHLEPLFVQYNVNVIFTGHIHAYARTTTVAFGEPNTKGPMHVTVGASGRQCCLTPFLSETPEPWVAARDGTHYGYGQFAIYNRTHAEWQWIPTSSSSTDPEDESDLPRRDVVILQNQYFLSTPNK